MPGHVYIAVRNYTSQQHHLLHFHFTNVWLFVATKSKQVGSLHLLTSMCRYCSECLDYEIRPFCMQFLFSYL